MLRLAIFMIGGGAMLTYANAKEFLLDRRASAKPESVKLADLEQGKDPSNPHIMIGPHLAVYSVGVYEYEKRSRDEAIPASIRSMRAIPTRRRAALYCRSTPMGRKKPVRTRAMDLPRDINSLTHFKRNTS